MRELHLVHGIKFSRGASGDVVSVLKEPRFTWERDATGSYTVTYSEDPTSAYVVPATGVRHERVVREKKK